VWEDEVEVENENENEVEVEDGRGCAAQNEKGPHFMPRA
jgi:hypothetical protein